MNKDSVIKGVLIVVLVLFLLLTGMAVYYHGFIGIFAYQLDSYAGMQVLVDLFIALALFLVWMWGDAKKTGRNPWPWLIITLAVGAIGPLLYLILRKNKTKQ